MPNLTLLLKRAVVIMIHNGFHHCKLPLTLTSTVLPIATKKGRLRVGKCQIFYTDQYQKTIFYPEKSAYIATFLALQTYKTELMGFLVINKCG